MAGGIEFLDADPTPGDDEHLPEPPHAARLPGTPRGRRIATLVAVVVLIVGAVVVRAATGSDPVRRAAPAPSSSPSPVNGDPVNGRLTPPAEIFCGTSDQPPPPVVVRTAPSSGRGTVSTPSPTVSSRVPGVRSQGAETDATVNCSAEDPAFCPQATDGQNACTTTGELPVAVIRAVQQRLPGSSFVSSGTEIVRETHGLWFRSVLLRQGTSVSVRIVVQQSGHDAGESGDADDGSSDVARAVHRGSDLTTIVEVTSPSGTHPDLAALVALAADPRLVAVG